MRSKNGKVQPVVSIEDRIKAAAMLLKIGQDAEATTKMLMETYSVSEDEADSYVTEALKIRGTHEPLPMLGVGALFCCIKLRMAYHK